MQPKIIHLILAALLICTAFAEKPSSKFLPQNAKEIDQLFVNSVNKVRFPGAVIWIEKNGIEYQKSYGSRSITPARTEMTSTTVFDAASLTKVIATAPAIMILAERGKLKLDDKVISHIKEFNSDLQANVTIKHLLTHTSGLPASIKADPPWTGYASAIRLAIASNPTSKPGTNFRYSDINFILLGEIVHRVTGQSLDQFTRAEIFAPLGMKDTGFNPPTNGRPRIAPTEKIDGALLHGTVHDPTARKMGGIAGHAGLFTTAPDLALFARMLVNGGQLNGKRILSEKSVSAMTSNQIPWRVKNAKRGYGWDINSDFSNPKGTKFGSGTYGHTGFTGTSLWIDPKLKSFVILLSNRNHPYERSSIKDIQWELGTLAATALGIH